MEETLASSPQELDMARFARSIGEQASVQVVYGQAVERDGVTVIPVARVRYGFGGGSGRKADTPETGAGGGGGVNVIPIGFIEIANGHAEFRRIAEPGVGLRRLAFAFLGAGVGLWFALRGMAALERRPRAGLLARATAGRRR